MCFFLRDELVRIIDEEQLCMHDVDRLVTGCFAGCNQHRQQRASGVCHRCDEEWNYCIV